MYLLGIDIGTSSTKTAIFNENGAMLSLASKQHNFDADKPGYAEQDPEVWWDAVITSMKEAIGKFGGNPKEIYAIGFSGQMHGMVPLDREGKVIRKAILHCDVRAKAEAEEIKFIFEDKFSKITYNPIFPGFQAISLYWMRKHEPQNFEKTRIVICPKDYVRYKMTGNIGIDSSDASGTLFYDMEKECWSEGIFHKLGFDMKVVPEKINNPYDIAGKIMKEVAELTGLSENTKVVFGGADQAMHSIGNGVYKSGTMMATIGTSGQILVIKDSPILNKDLNTHFFHHVNPHTWFGLAAVLYAGSTLNWFRRNFSENYTYEELDKMADQIKPCSDGLVFFPSMGGDRTPYVDTNTRGIYSGISLSHTRAHFARATMEGVTFSVKSSINIMNKLFGKEEKLICAGGGAKSLTWAQIQADVYGREIFISNILEQACLGAAIVAGIGAGVFSSLDEACSQMVDTNERKIEPNLINTAIYQNYYESVYENLYYANKKIFESMQNY